jgi:hypothetical protein
MRERVERIKGNLETSLERFVFIPTSSLCCCSNFRAMRKICTNVLLNLDYEYFNFCVH